MFIAIITAVISILLAFVIIFSMLQERSRFKLFEKEFEDHLDHLIETVKKKQIEPTKETKLIEVIEPINNRFDILDL